MGWDSNARKSSHRQISGVALPKGRKGFKANRYLGTHFRPHTIGGRRG